MITDGNAGDGDLHKGFSCRPHWEFLSITCDGSGPSMTDLVVKGRGHKPLRQSRQPKAIEDRLRALSETLEVHNTSEAEFEPPFQVDKVRASDCRNQRVNETTLSARYIL